jgi:hypothetical protein
MPRPPKITEQHIRDAEEAQRLGLTYDLTSGYIGIGRSTFYSWLAKGRKTPGGVYGRFVDALERGRAKGAALSLARIQRAAQGGQWQADAWILERRHGYRKESSDVDASIDKSPPNDSTIDTARRAARRTLKTITGGKS